jgi:hypothetical protein
MPNQAKVVINLDRYKELFRDEAAFERFVALLAEDLEHDFRPILVGDRMIGASLSAEGAKHILYDRMIRRLGERPELLGELTRRLSDDEIVE